MCGNQQIDNLLQQLWLPHLEQRYQPRQTQHHKNTAIKVTPCSHIDGGSAHRKEKRYHILRNTILRLEKVVSCRVVASTALSQSSACLYELGTPPSNNSSCSKRSGRGPLLVSCMCREIHETLRCRPATTSPFLRIGGTRFRKTPSNPSARRTPTGVEFSCLFSHPTTST